MADGGTWRGLYHPAVVFALVLAVYLASMPRTVTLEDSGMFIMSCDVAGVSHPPGYPIHSLLGKLFTLLPIGTAAFRVHLLSAVFGALTCSVLWLLCRRLTGSIAAAYAGALAYGVSAEFWAQSIIAEVYSIAAFLFFLALYLAVRYREDGGGKRLAVLSLVCGLGLAHHWPIQVLSLPALVAALWPRRREIGRRALPVLGGIAVGLLPYVYLVIRSQTDPAISFYGPIDSWKDFSFFVLRQGYSAVDRSESAVVMDQVRLAGYFFRQASVQFTPLGAVLAAGGLVLAWRRLRREVFVALVLAFAGTSLMLIALLHRDYEFMQRAVFKVYPLVPYGAMAVWIAVAAAGAADFVRTKRPRAATTAAVVLAAVVPAAALLANWRTDMRAHDTWARDYARAVLGALDPDAVLFTHEDTDTGPIGYLNRVEGVRPDVEVFNDQGLVFSNRLFSPPASERLRRRRLAEFVARTDRPVYFTGVQDLPYGTTDFGLFYRIERDAAPGEKRVTVDERLLGFLRRILDAGTPTDMWTLDHRQLLFGDFGRILGVAVHLGGDPGKAAELRPLLDRVSATFYGKLGMIEGLATRFDPAQLLAWLDEARARIDDTTSKRVLARYHYLRGFVLVRRGGDLAGAAVAFEESLRLDPGPQNGAGLNLLELYAQGGDRARYRALRQRLFGRGHDVPEAVRRLDRGMGFR
jgi:uncharacterized membrane protein